MGFRIFWAGGSGCRIWSLLPKILAQEFRVEDSGCLKHERTSEACDVGKQCNTVTLA